jgi:alpha-glucosidase
VDDAGAHDTGSSDAPSPDPCEAAGGFATELPWSGIIGGFDVTLSRTPPIFRLESATGEPLDAYDVAVQVATGAPSVRMEFGAFDIELDAPDAEMVWAPVEEVFGACVTPKGARLRLQHGEGEVTLAFEVTAQGDLGLALEGHEGGGELAFGCREGDEFFGLGTQAVGMELSQRTYPLWTQEQGIGKPPGAPLFPLNNIPEAAYAPLGVWHWSRGLSAVVGHDGFFELGLCQGDAPRIALRSYPDPPSLVLTQGATPKTQVQAVTEYTGRLSQQPPDWVFGTWADAVGGPERLRAVAKLLRDEDVPVSAIWTEDWIGGTQESFGFRLSYAWEWDDNRYPDLPQDIEELHAQGFAFLAYFNTFVPEPTRMWEEGLAGDYLVRLESGEVFEFLDPAFRNAGLVDLTNPAAREWMRGYLHTAATELEVDGWMVDFGEWLPHTAALHDGTSGWRGHNTHPLEWQRLSLEVLEEANPADASEGFTYFARSGWASVNGGTPGIAPTMWAGDQETGTTLDDGMPTVVPIGAHVGLSGVAIYGHDIAGFSSIGHPPTDKRLFFRWCTLGALSPLMRTHHGSSECANWTFDRDAETLQHFRRWSKVHALLLPYLRGAAREAQQTGTPIFRHPWLEFPQRRELWGDQVYSYFLGEDIYVAPSFDTAETTRAVIFPSENFWPLFGVAPVVTPAGSDRAGVGAPLTEILAFVRPGTILPLQGTLVDSYYGATAAGVTDLSDAGNALRLGLYPSASGDLDPIEVAGATVSGAGFDPTRPLDAQVTVDGNAVPVCEQPRTPPCWDAAQEWLVVSGGAVIEHEGARLTIARGGETTWLVAWAGKAFGELAAPTALNEPDAEVEPPCGSDR